MDGIWHLKYAYPIRHDYAYLGCSYGVASVTSAEAIALGQVPALVLPREDGSDWVAYAAWPHQVRFHAATSPNVLALGTRGTGKSLMLRWDAIMRCLMIPNFRALIIRRTMPELRRSHLAYIGQEMAQLGQEYLSTFSQAKFENGSTLTFAHCETQADVMNFLSSEYGFIGFDELSTFTLEQFLKISAAARAPLDAGYNAVIRAGSNPLGVGADWMYDWFVDHTVRLEDFPDYLPEDFEMQFSTLDDNPSMDATAYRARLRNLPEHVRRAWLDGERIIEGMYFMDFHKTAEDGTPWHVIPTLPTWKGAPLFEHTWLRVYRAIDWGYFPDPAVCLWMIVLPNKRTIVFKERSWRRTLAKDVATQIKKESEGMHIVESFCDPTMLIKEGQPYSIGELFEQNGVPVTPAINDRVLYGYSIHDQFNTLIDGTPQMQIVAPVGLYGCPDLIRTIPQLRTDPTDPAKIANGNDHWVVALAYFCMGQASPSTDPTGGGGTPRWMRAKANRPALVY